MRLTDYAARGDMANDDGRRSLYADSYIDLVTIDLGRADYLVVDRQEAIFPYDPYQNAPEDIDFLSVDESLGVVIGHE